MPESFDGLPDFPFRIEHTDGAARAGVLRTPRGDVNTPCFMPVGTKGTVKAMTPEGLRNVGAQVILANTYHLSLRPGSDTVKRLGGLHRFMGWDGPILTDSGGYQVFSLRDIARVDDSGAEFLSVYDGSKQIFTPERAIDEQQTLGADIIMCLDQCAPGGADSTVLAEAVRRTSLWAERCKTAHRQREGSGSDGPQMLLGIAQGGTDRRLRRESVERLVEIGFPGYAIGGLSVGEERGATLEATEIATSLLPQDRLRYFMGIGDPAGLIEAVARGVDMFDCVLPTRTARMGTAFTSEGKLNLRNAEHSLSEKPLDPGCTCTACRTFSRGAIRHFVLQKEIMGLALLTEHNLTFLMRLVDRVRQAIAEGAFAELRKAAGSWGAC